MRSHFMGLNTGDWLILVSGIAVAGLLTLVA
jgi:hypothetical protein